MSDRIPIHKTNPFVGSKDARSATIYAPNVYSLNLLVSLPPESIRVLLIITFYYNDQLGYSDCDYRTMKKHIHKGTEALSRAVRSLLEHNLIAKHSGFGKWFINTNIFRPVTFEL